MALERIVLLVGGVGGAKLAHGLSRIVPPENLTIIVNTGDDFWLYGLRICPDIDTILYTLSGSVNPVNGWGVRDDTTVTMDALAQLGENPWFRLGDIDMATHLVRTQRWHEGQSLTAITQALSQSMGVEPTVLPMCDTPVATRLDTIEHGELGFQDYFVRYRWQPTLTTIRYEGIESASVSAAVGEAIEQANAIILGPSNPWLSINPILSVPGMRDLIQLQRVPRIAITPIISGKAVKGPTAKIMQEMELPITAQTIAGVYEGVINGFVSDIRDDGDYAVKNIAYDTLMTDNSRRIDLAKEILSWIENWN
jgi:LPPG:FO 2-phospho-L-lactate transferase